jgi:type IV secretory pathway VirB4 component
VDEATGAAFKISSQTEYTGIFDADPELGKLVKPLEGTYSVTKPGLQEIVSDFELKEDTVQLNKANIIGFAPNVELAVKPLSTVDDNDKNFKYLTSDNLI